MKNLILPLLFVGAIATATAQKNENRRNDRKEFANNMSPETMASIQAKKMTLALDLSDQQEQEVEQVLLQSTIARKESNVEKKDRKEMTKADRASMMEARLDNQIATKRALKDILNEKQYEKFEKMKKDRVRKGMNKNRVKRS